jgi:hypothetical protein
LRHSSPSASDVDDAAPGERTSNPLNDASLDPEDDECWHVVNVADGRGDIAETRDLEALARDNGIVLQL